MTLPPHHEPGAMLGELRQRHGQHGDLWVFGYASLIWRPEFHATERRPALVRGWHRALRMRSKINRGTPERPGLVFALLPGGACRGEVFRLRARDAEPEMQRLWQREMILPVYTPRWLPCRTSQGDVLALGFTLSRRSEACTPRLPEAQMLDILRHARGRFGSTLEYLAQTAQALRERRIRDAEIERLMALAVRAGLLQAAPAARSPADSVPLTVPSSTPGSSTVTPQAG